MELKINLLTMKDILPFMKLIALLMNNLLTIIFYRIYQIKGKYCQKVCTQKIDIFIFLIIFDMNEYL